MRTGLYAGLCGLLFIWLSWLVIKQRQRAKIGLGDGGDPDLQRAIRVHANFIEYTPFALLLLLLVEMTTANALVVSRALHAQGLGATAGYSRGRYLGTLGTWVVITGLALLLVAMTLHTMI